MLISETSGMLFNPPPPPPPTFNLFLRLCFTVVAMKEFLKYSINLFAHVIYGHFLSLSDWTIALKPKLIGAFNRKFNNYIGSCQIFKLLIK